jgi:beta-glucoside operon transcriptional antiterminator
MRAVKKINNNVAVCKDGMGNELIAFGKGIGFPAMPYEIHDLNKIDRTFYNLSNNFLGLMNEIPEEIVEFSAKMVNIVNGKENKYNPNVLLTLSDHITFALKRKKKGIKVQMPLAYEIKQRYPKEMEYGRYILKELNKTLHVNLEQEEAVGLALNLVNARLENMAYENDLMNREEKALEEITQIIERELDFSVDRDSFNYNRFSTHLQYLLKRIDGKQYIESGNHSMYDAVAKEYQKMAECVELVNKYLIKNFYCDLTDEEKLYLIMHVNRVYSQEEAGD